MKKSLGISTKTRFIGLQDSGDKTPVYVFSYTVTINNNLSQQAQLKNRYWLITNGDGEKVEVQGEGVVGEQPIIQPNESFEYTSASMIKTEVGTMEGYYEFEFADGQFHREPIPVFNLSKPNSIH
ncbi:MAG: ApaG protein [Glaciecola sp.]|jgi:ApaG protein